MNYYDCRPDDAPECIFLTVAEAWEEYGLPRTLYICRDDSESYFIDLVQHLGLKLKRVKRLPAAARSSCARWTRYDGGGAGLVITIPERPDAYGKA